MIKNNPTKTMMIKNISKGQKEGAIELRVNKKNLTVYLKVFPFTEEIWVDFYGLPSSAVFWAMSHRLPFLECVVGEDEKEKRYFVNIDWVINDWDGPPEFIDKLIEYKENIVSRFDEFRKMRLEENEKKTKRKGLEE